MIRAYVKAQLSAIRLNGLHGIHLSPPSGFLRGIDVLGEPLFNQIVLSCRQYCKTHDRLPDLVSPRTFTEKQLLFKFFGPVAQQYCPSDKLRSVAFALRSVCGLFQIPNRPFIMDAPTLPDNGAVPPGPWFFKSNHGSGTNQRIFYPLSSDDRATLQETARDWLTKTHGQKMSLWWYGMMPRNVYLEQDLGNLNRDAPDWKFFVFNGKVEIFQVDVDRSGDHVQTIYDRNGKFLNTTLYYKSGPPVPMPDDLDVMIRIAEGIGRNFDFIRVDMFRHDGAIILGEIGLVPNGASSSVKDFALDLRLGLAWRAPWMGKVLPGYPAGHYGRLELSDIE